VVYKNLVPTGIIVIHHPLQQVYVRAKENRCTRTVYRGARLLRTQMVLTTTILKRE